MHPRSKSSGRGSGYAPHPCDPPAAALSRPTAAPSVARDPVRAETAPSGCGPRAPSCPRPPSAPAGRTGATSPSRSGAGPSATSRRPSRRRAAGPDLQGPAGEQDALVAAEPSDSSCRPTSVTAAGWASGSMPRPSTGRGARAPGRVLLPHGAEAPGRGRRAAEGPGRQAPRSDRAGVRSPPCRRPACSAACRPWSRRRARCR